jgi:hypothetical protein
MMAVPRDVIRIQSPEEQRHRGHGLGDDQLADLVYHRVAGLVECLHLGAQRPRLQLAPVDRQQWDPANESRAEVGAAAGREQPRVRREVLVDPVEALGREGRAGGADASNSGQVAPSAGLQAGLHAAGDVAGAGSEARQLSLLGEVP